MTQQTAVEWLIEQLRQLAHNPSTHLGMGDIRVTQGMIDDLEEQAKQMEKEQLENARPQIISNCAIKEMSNEEIWNASIEYDNRTIQETPMVNFQQGAFWYREQLKKK